MLSLSDFFTPDEVRAALGVSNLELEDATLDLDMYLRHLEIELLQYGQNIISDFYTTVSLPAPTAADQLFTSLVKQFSLYSVAVLVAESSPNFSPRNITDGKGGFIRHSDSYKEVLARVTARMQQAGDRLSTAYKTYLGSSKIVVVPTLFEPVTPSFDPVTGV